ncbi:Coiled-coil domain-containing protein 148 [Argiope bruennichi]|uniref:Coiled-coil domain-containing protein 148 n=1 Tax=Argiope bruennichi TaxID=94029 RepID=A0A8T0FSD8_ARGBR|nr:Coiled-coil domain-containing protein 148 [Argiope bruennichi]
MKEEKSEVMAEVALTRGVEVLPSINSNTSISKLDKNKSPAAGSPTKTVDPTKGSPKKRKMLRFTGVPRTRPDVSPTRALKPLHNDRINGLAAAKKSTNRILERADHFKTVTQSKKELALLFQHKVIWEQEYMHLQYLEDRLQREIYNHLTIYGQLGADGQLLLADNINFILEIEEEKAFFRENVVDPLWYIREDLKEWVRQHEGLRPLSDAAKVQHYQIKREVKELWVGYKEIAEDLLKEQRELEQQVKEALPPYVMAEEKQIAKGVPPEFHELYCPDPQLKENLIAELTRLDDSYSFRLRDLDRNCDRQACPGGWNDHDSAMFEHILEQYPPDLPDRRVLCFDRLKRTFPHKTLGQLMSYETWYQNNKFHKDRRKKCLEDWARERWSWLLRAVTEISQAQQSHAGHQLSRDEALRQKFKCEVLRQRVEQWKKEKKNERLQKSEREAQRKLALKVGAAATGPLKKNTGEIWARQRLAAFTRKGCDSKRKRRCSPRRRNARKNNKEHPSTNKERVRYRTELFYANQKERRERMLKLREDEKARQQRLDQLRKQVQVNIDEVPDRIHQDTVASQARKEASSEGLALKALHELRTVLDAEVHRDPRVRLEQQLREAGLLNSEYARYVLSQMHPPREPRKDTRSSLFLQDQDD